MHGQLVEVKVYDMRPIADDDKLPVNYSSMKDRFTSVSRELSRFSFFAY